METKEVEMGVENASTVGDDVGGPLRKKRSRRRKLFPTPKLGASRTALPINPWLSSQSWARQ
jgi:hypothetical protein